MSATRTKRAAPCEGIERFAKVHLRRRNQTGHSQPGSRAFSFYDVEKKNWKAER